MSEDIPLGEPTAKSVEDILEDAREDVLDFVEGLLDAMDLDGDVEADITTDGEIYASINGGDAGLLIGSRGQTLDSIQELLRTAVGRATQSRVRIMLDIEGYRDRRRTALVAEAAQMAERALQEGEVELQPMTAYERKIIHDAVAGIAGVTSFSEGQDPNRKVILRADEDPAPEDIGADAGE
ncbi:MAG: R3H domain-containing nucleic acid-binding protein [Actinomycetota bacterium]